MLHDAESAPTKKTLRILSAAFSLSACAQAEITTPPVLVTPKNPSRAVGLDMYAKSRACGGQVPRFRGQEIVQVRASGEGSDCRQVELSGVPCVMDSVLFSAQFLTPANVVVPDFGPSSPALFVHCTPGEMSGSATVTTCNFATQQRMNGGSGGGLLGVIIVAAVAAAAVSPEKDEFKYPPITVRVKQGPPARRLCRR